MLRKELLMMKAAKSETVRVESAGIGEIQQAASELVSLLGGPKVAGVIKISTSMMPEYPPVVECGVVPEVKPAPPPKPVTIDTFSDRAIARELVRRVMKEGGVVITEIRIQMASIDDKYRIDYTVEQHYNNV